MSGYMPWSQVPLFTGPDDIEGKIQAILAGRLRMNASGQAGEDIEFIRAAIAKSTGATQ
jgi:hypothetical protein